VGRPGLEPGT